MSRNTLARRAIALCLFCLVPSPAYAEVEGPPRVRHVYIPANQLKVVFGTASKGVLMPRDDILALWQKARRQEQSAPAPPADAVLAAAHYEARLNDHELRLTGRIRIATLREGWQTVDLPFGGLAIESAEVDDQPARFGLRDDGTLFLLLDRKGRSELKLEMSAPLASKGGDLAATLRLPPVAASELVMHLDEGKQLQSGETILQRDGTGDDQQTFRLAVDHTGLVPLLISDRLAGGNRSPLVFVSSRSTALVEPAGLRWEVVLDLDVYARATDTFQIQLPNSVDVAEVDSPQLDEWTIEDRTNDQALLTLRFRKPVLGRRSVRLLGLAPISLVDPWRIPTVKVLEAAAHVGQVAVYPSPSLRVDVGTLAGIRSEPLSSISDGDPGNGSRGGTEVDRSMFSANVLDAKILQLAEKWTSPRSPREPLRAPAANGAPLGFAFWDENFELPLRVVPRHRIVQASVATLVEVNRTGLALRASLSLEPRHAPLFGVELQLPRGWQVTSVLCADNLIDWQSDAQSGTTVADGSLQTVKFDLPTPLSPGQSMEITLAAQRHPEDWLKDTDETQPVSPPSRAAAQGPLQRDERFHELPLPELRVVGADEVEGTLLVRTPAEIELVVTDLSDDLEPAAADQSRSSPQAGSETALQYRYQDDARVSGRLRVRTMPAKVSAETLAFVRLDRDRLDVHYQVDMQIRQGRIRQIGFTLPAAVGEKIVVVPVDSAARILEQRHTPVSDGPGPGSDLTLWTVIFDRPMTGDLTLAVDCTQTLSEAIQKRGQAAYLGDDLQVQRTASGSQSPFPDSLSVEQPAKAAVPATVPVLALQNVSRQSGMVALEAAGDQQLDYRPENLRELDPADVLKPKGYVPTQRIVAAYQYQRLPYRLTISATRHKSEPVLGAICESAEITSVAGRQGRIRHQARFRLRSSNLQHVPVTLPEKTDLWTVMLDGEPVEVRRKQGDCIIPLPPNSADPANDARELTLVYETESRAPVAGRRFGLLPTTIRHVAPTVALTTLRTTWYVHLPDTADLVSAGGDFEPVARLTRPTLVTRLAESIAQRSTTLLSWKFGGLVVAIVIAGFYALVSTGKGCASSLVEILVVMTVIGLLIALLLPATQSAREAARRSQCSNNLKQIGLALHNYHDTYGQFPPAAIGPYNVSRDRQFSWIVAILPFLEQQPLYDKLRLDLPCDHPHNVAVLQIAPTALFCPSDPAPSATLEGFPKTSYVAVTGADSTLGAGSTRGVIGFEGGLRLEEIVDGANNTIMVAEVTDGGPWFAGGSGTARRIDDWVQKRTWSQHPGGGSFVFADGSVRFLSSATEPHTLRHLATARGLDDAGDESAGRAAVAAAPIDETAEAAPAPAVEALEEAKRPAAPTPPSDKPSTQLPTQPIIQPGGRARLSLRVALETEGAPAVRFRREGQPGELVLGLQDRTFARTVQAWLVAAGLLAAWIARRAPAPRRWAAFVAGAALPIGLSGLVPLAWTPLLDGLLLGALAAGALWTLLNIIAMVQTSASAPMLSAMALAAGLLSADASLAAETPPQSSRSANLTLFIPYDPENGSPLEHTQVYLPHDEFLRLWKQANPGKPKNASPGVRAVVSHAEYSGRLQNDVARFDGRLVIHHLDESWASVTLPLGDVAFESVEINGRPATLADRDPKADRQTTQPPEDDGGSADSQPRKQTRATGTRPVIYLEDPGLHVVDVRFRVPVSRLGATGQLAVPLRAVPSGRLLLELPARDLDVHVAGCPGGWRRQKTDSEDDSASAESGGELVAIPLGAADEISIRWQPQRVAMQTGQLVSVDQVLTVEVQDSAVQFQSRFHYRIQQGSLNRLEFRIPSGVAVHSVQGAEVADWSIETDAASGDSNRPRGGREGDRSMFSDNVLLARTSQPAEKWTSPQPPRERLPGEQSPAQRLVVSLKAEVSTSTTVDVHSFRRDRQTTGAVDVGSLEPIGVARETGRIAIACSNHFEVRVGRSERLDQINRMELDPAQRSGDGCALLSAYRYTSRPWRLPLLIERRRPHVDVSNRTAVAVSTRQATLQAFLTANVTGAPVPSLSIRLPATLRLSQVHVPPGADWFVDRDDGGQRLKVNWNQAAVGKFDLAIHGSLVRDSSQPEFAVPGVEVEEVEAQRGQLAVYLDEDLEAVLIAGGGARALDPAALDGSLQSDPSGPARYAFQYDSPPDDLRLRLSAAPPRMNAEVTSVVSVREGAVAYASNIDYEIRRAGQSEFRIATPPWLGDDLELTGEHVRQVRSHAAEEGRIWEVQLQRPVRETYRLQLVQTLPLSDDGAVEAAIVRPLDVERSRSHVVLENLTADEIAATTTRALAPVSIDEVPKCLAEPVRRQAVAAYRIGDGPARLAWQRRVREQESGLAASINLADLTTVVQTDGRYRARAAYNIRNFTLQFLELELPPESRIWAVHVSGQPVRPASVLRQGRPVTLLPLEKTSAGDFSSKVVIIYSGELEKPLGLWTRVRPPAPRILSDVPVSRTLWTVLMPPEYRVDFLKDKSNLEAVAATYQQEERKLSLLDELQQMVQVAGSKSRSAARSKAQYNLKQIGSALQDYAEQSSQLDAKNAAEVQQQARQLEAEIQRLEESKTDARRADAGADSYFESPPQRVRIGGAPGQTLEDLPELKIAPSEAQPAPSQVQSADRPEQRRGRLRERAAEQLERLQTAPEEQRAPPEKPVPQPSPTPQREPQADTIDLPSVVDQRSMEPSPSPGQAAPADAATGHLSLDLDLAFVGTPYHFRKLHGEPRLVLRARHENLRRGLTAIVWAVVCLAMAAAAIHFLRRRHAAAIAHRWWPWLAAALGVVWLFLLPAGILGFALLVVALCVLIANAREPQPG